MNGFKYALQVFIANLKAKLQVYGIFYDRKNMILKKKIIQIINLKINLIVLIKKL